MWDCTRIRCSLYQSYIFMYREVGTYSYCIHYMCQHVEYTSCTSRGVEICFTAIVSFLFSVPNRQFMCLLSVRGTTPAVMWSSSSSQSSSTARILFTFTSSRMRWVSWFSPPSSRLGTSLEVTIRIVRWNLVITRTLDHENYLVISGFSLLVRWVVQWNLVIMRTLRPWKLPCYIRVKNKEV